MSRRAVMQSALALILYVTLLGGCRSESSKITRAIVSQTNTIRTGHRLASLTPNAELDRAARKYARYMARKHTYGHHVDGRTPGQRVERAGYPYALVCENVAWLFPGSLPMGQPEVARQLVTGWFDSQGHRENMLNREVVHIGTGVAWSKKHDTYFAVQLFGRPDWLPPVRR